MSVSKGTSLSCGGGLARGRKRQFAKFSGEIDRLTLASKLIGRERRRRLANFRNRGGPNLLKLMDARIAGENRLQKGAGIQ
jgi:hypothetical protein